LARYTRIENAHKARKKTFVFCYVVVMYNYCGGRTDTGLCEQVMINPAELAIYDEAPVDAHIASIGVPLY